MQNVRNTLLILETVAALQPVGVSELGRELGLPKSTVQRALGVLSDTGWIRSAGHELTRWEITTKALHVGQNATGNLNLRDVALPVMEKLRAQTEETIHLMVPEGDTVVLIERLSSPKLVRIDIPLGRSAPIHTVSNGKAILARTDSRKLEQILDKGLPRHTPQTITDPTELRAEIVAIRDRGYAINSGEWRSDIRAVASAILDRAGQPVASISISTPADRMPPARQRSYGRLVTEAARAITATLRGPVHSG